MHESGSLTAAAERLGISYRKAWDDLKKAEAGIGYQLIEKSRGGSGGGRTELTPEGVRLLQLYEAFAARVERYAAEAYQALEARLRDGETDGTPT